MQDLGLPDATVLGYRDGFFEAARTANKRHFLDVSGEVVERVDPIFYSDPLTAALKALGMN